MVSRTIDVSADWSSLLSSARVYDGSAEGCFLRSRKLLRSMINGGTHAGSFG